MFHFYYLDKTDIKHPSKIGQLAR